MKLFGEEEIYYFNKLKEQIPDCYVAGGAIRDYLHLKEYSDIDIFLPIKNELFKKYGYAYLVDEVCQEIFDLSTSGSISFPTELDYAVDSILDVEKNNIKYQLIFVSQNPLEHIRKYFDLNCCKVAFGGTEIYRTPEYKQFEKTRELEVKPSKNYFHNLKDRVEKIQTKYDDIKIGPNLTKVLQDLEAKKISKKLISEVIDKYAFTDTVTNTSPEQLVWIETKLE